MLMVSSHRLLRMQRLGAGLAAALLTLPCAAHHSFAMFDNGRTIVLVGTVKEFQWTNPHCWIQLVVPGQPRAVEWSIQLGSTGQLYRIGWRPGTLTPGLAVSVSIHPMRDGTPGGQFVSAQSADGKLLGPSGAGATR